MATLEAEYNENLLAADNYPKDALTGEKLLIVGNSLKRNA